MTNAPGSRPQIMTLTDSAADRVRQMLATKPNAVGLKIGLKKGGCAGMEYTLDWAEEVGKFDEQVEYNGAKVLIDPMATLYILGTEMDYKVDKLSAQFVFNNPNQTSACGCGESVELQPAQESQLERLGTGGE
ncbi:MAG: HesB/IscA family protein [Hyphomicrobiaceae bacterium]